MCMGQNSAGGIATRYKLDGQGDRIPKRRRIFVPVILALGPTKLPVQWVPAVLPKEKTTGT